MTNAGKRGQRYGLIAAAALYLFPCAAMAGSKIPIGPADENEQTSRALTAILDQCIAAYSHADAMRATGQYFTVSKFSDDSSTHSSARVSLDFIRPDKMAVVVNSDSSELSGRFIADGLHVTIVSANTKKFEKLPQPKALAAFADTHRAGEIYEEGSGAFSISAIAPMLISDDPRAILYEGIVRYIYEGEEKIGGHNCHRVRFVQDNPKVIVILWIDTRSGFIRKSSFISSYDEDYDFVQSYEAGETADMRIMVWDDITTDPAKISDAAFKAVIPKNYKPASTSDKTTYTLESAKDPGFWESLVSTAANNSSEKSTWSLTRERGKIDLEFREFAELPDSILDFTAVRLPDSPEPRIGVMTKNGTVTVRDSTGAALTTFSVGMKPTAFAFMDTKSHGPLFLALNENKSTLLAYDSAGKKVWSYRHPYALVKSISTTSATEPAAYVVSRSLRGIRKLDENGKVAYANMKPDFTSMLTPAPPGVDRVLYSGLYEWGLLDKKLNLLQSHEDKGNFSSLLWDTQNKKYPVIDVMLTYDTDVLLQRRAEDGDIDWTTTIVPKLETVKGSGLRWFRARVGDSIQRCLFLMLTDGQIVITSENGDVLYRGLVTANKALVRRNEDMVLPNIAIADLNHDGLDEIYTKLDTHLLYFTCE